MLERHEILEEQGGFRRGRGCSDVLFTWAEVVRGRRTEDKATYCAFIDVKKAYDRVWRDGLWKRLWDAGVRGKMWRIIKNMYQEVKSCVMVEGEQTEWFETLLGVRQGCVISPILYSVFINGFAKELIRKRAGGVRVGEDVLRLLLFADDIVLFAEDGGKLQEMLIVLEEYCHKWRFEVNVKKSKVMVCGSPQIIVNESGSWSFGGKLVDRVSEYKYVGVMVSENGTWDEHARYVKEKASGKTQDMQFWLGRHWEISPRVKVDVWKSMVGSVLRYGSEVWFLNKLPARNLEAVQLGMIKSTLRVNKSTTDEFVRGEVGVFELERERDRSLLLFFGRIMEMDEDRWVKKLWCAEWDTKKKGFRSWNWKVDELIKRYGISEEAVKLKEGVLKEKWGNVVRNAVRTKAIEGWRDGIRQGKKLQVYNKIKTEWGFENYLRNVSGKGEILMGRFRSGSAGIGEELARYGGGGAGVWEADGTEKKKSAMCKACDEDCVETLLHLLVECKAYDKERGEWFREVQEVGVGVGVGVGEGVGGGGGGGSGPLELMLGGQHPGLSDDGRLRVLAASTRFFVTLWSARAIKIHGQRCDESLGVNDAQRYGTT
jgi:hypothetical protein